MDPALLGQLPNLLTWSGLAVYLLIATVRGWWLPKATHEREISILEKRIEEKAEESREWRAAYQAEQSVGQEVRMQNRMLLEQGQTSAHALEGIRSSLVQMARKDLAP